MTNIAKTIGDNIRQRRKALKLSQLELAKSAKLSHITLNRYEKGKQAPQGANLIALAKALKCEPEDLYEQAAAAKNDGPTVEEIASLVLAFGKAPLPVRLDVLNRLGLTASGKYSPEAFDQVLGIDTKSRATNSSDDS